MSPLSFISLGSNMGDRRAACREALRRLGETPGVCVVRRSGLYRTEPVGTAPMPDFLNLAVAVDTTLPPQELLAACKAIERALGRTSRHLEPRPIDLDILFYGSEVLDEPALRVPHPRLHERRFVLEPLCEIAPDLRHPVLGWTVSKMLSFLKDGARVERLGDEC